MTDLDDEVVGSVGLLKDLQSDQVPDAQAEDTPGFSDRQTIRLQTAAEISRATTSSLGLDEILSQSVELIRARFDLYYVGVFLLDDRDEWAVLRAGSGTSGQRMLGAQHRLRRGSDSMIGQCVATSEPQIALDVAEARVRFENPVLPETRSELALPLVSRGRILGAMTVQSTIAVAFSEEDITFLQTLADQLANAVAATQFYQMSQTNFQELQRLQQRYTSDMWNEYVEREDVLGYSFDLKEVTPLTTYQQVDFSPAQLAVDDGMIADRVPAGPIIERGVEGGKGGLLMQPLQIRGEMAGYMSFEEPGTVVEWSEDQVAVLDAVHEQLELTLENRLLIDRSQRALREARRREAELGFLQEVSVLLNATNDVVEARSELFQQLQGFLPLNQLAMTGYDSGLESVIWLGGEGRAQISHYYSDPRTDFRGTGFEWVIANQSIAVQDDLRQDLRFPEDEYLVGTGVASRLLIPLSLGDRRLGALELDSDQVGAFSRPGLMPILQQAASQVASAMERGSLLRVAQSSAEESRRLYEATSDLAEAVDAADILDAIVRHAFPTGPASQTPARASQTPARASRMIRAELAVYVVDPETGSEQEWLEIVAASASPVEPSSIGGPRVLPVGTRLRVSEMPSAALLDRAQVVVSEDIASDSRLSPEARETYLSDDVRSLVALSLSTGVGTSERIGILRVFLSRPHRASEEDLRLYRTISDQAAVVLSNRQLFQESQARIERQAVAVELANLTTSLSERESLLQTSVDFLGDRFDLYFAGVFLNDDQGEWAVLEAGSGDVGERLMSMGHRVQVGGKAMVARCIEQRSRILVMDIDRTTAMLENPLLPDMRSAVAFPLVSRGQTTGGITLQSTQRFAFTQEDLATLELMVNQLANVIESTNLYERSQASLAETRMLYRIAQQITDARDAEAALEAAVAGIAQRSEPDFVIAGLLEPRDNPTTLNITVSWSRDGTPFPCDSLSLDTIRQFYEVLRSDERFVTPNITQDPIANEALRRIYSDLRLRAMAAFQLSLRGRQYGTIMVHCHNARKFSTAELSFYENVSRQAFVALENIGLVDAARERAERRDILNEVLQTASGSLDHAQILQEVSQVIARRLNMPVATWEWDGVATQPIAVCDAGGELLASRHEGFQLVGSVMERIHTTILDREPTDVRFEDGGGISGLHHGFASPLVTGYAVPLAARDVVYGGILLGQQLGHADIDDLEREFTETVGANVGVALETAALYADAQETAEKLQELDKLKNQFMANMSHELRTPLNSIIGFSRVIMKGIDGPLTEMQETDLAAIYDSGRHLLNLINDILDISKINAGKMEVAFEPVDIAALIKSVMSTAMGFVKDKPVKLLTDVPVDLPMVVADSRRIRQVLTNLLGNAGKFTDEGFIKVSAYHDTYQVVVMVQDTGIGIPSDRISAVFAQFEQVDSSSSRRYQGTGLGVPLSREFVRLHGGDIWIQSSVVGEGTTFCFTLPIGGPDSLKEETPDTEQDRVVLAVDDDQTVITLFRRYLERKGYKVFGLTRGERVVEEAIRLKPYAITLDVLMPGQDGWAVIQDLKANPETRDIPIIVCSVLGEQDKGISMGVTDYLLKPISESLLLDTLASLNGDGDAGHVLIVDDNPDDRKLLRRILGNAGYEVRETTGGAEAIDRIRTEAPSLVVLDLMMPDVDGFAVLEQLKRSPPTRSIPVVVVTAKELTPSDRARLQQGVAALLQKGLFDQQQLLSDVTAALNRLSPE